MLLPEISVMHHSVQLNQQFFFNFTVNISEAKLDVIVFNISRLICLNTSRPATLLKKTPTQKPALLLKKRPWHRCFPINFAKFMGTPFLQNTSGRLLLRKTSPKTAFIESFWKQLRSHAFHLEITIQPPNHSVSKNLLFSEFVVTYKIRL